jgi:hypothetical protein
MPSGDPIIYTTWKYSKFAFKWYPYHIFLKKATTDDAIRWSRHMYHVKVLKICFQMIPISYITKKGNNLHFQSHSLPCHIVQTMPNDSNVVYELAWLHYYDMFAWFLFIPLESTGNECHPFRSDTGRPVHSGPEKLWPEWDLSGTPCRKSPLDSTGFQQIPKIPVGSNRKPWGSVTSSLKHMLLLQCGWEGKALPGPKPTYIPVRRLLISVSRTRDLSLTDINSLRAGI